MSKPGGFERKIKKLNALKKIAGSLRSRDKKIVFTNGCFDILHYGHVKYLQDAKNKGDILIVGVNSDASIKRIKGKMRPVVAQGDRLRTIAALESVDYAVAFDEDTPIKLIENLRPHVLVKGADWKKDSIVGASFVASYGGKVLGIRLVKGRSTTGLIEKIAKVFTAKKR